MQQMKIKIGPVTFDRADYDADADVLYLHVGEPREAEGEETPEGHVLRCAPGTQTVVGLTVIGARRILDRDGKPHRHDPKADRHECRRSRPSPRCRLR